MVKTKTLRFLSFIHVALIVLSNVLVQYPFECLGLHTTWGAFSYPLIFVTTDLTTRLLGASVARRVIFKSMIPGLIVSFILASFFNGSGYMIGPFYELPLRIALACFSAYALGQLLDVSVFNKIRQNNCVVQNNNSASMTLSTKQPSASPTHHLTKRSWWLAPTLATTLGNIVDTFVFFSLAFYHCHDPFLATHWIEIACVDFGVKTISLLAFIPLYGVILGTYLHYQWSLSH